MHPDQMGAAFVSIKSIDFGWFEAGACPRVFALVPAAAAADSSGDEIQSTAANQPCMFTHLVVMATAYALHVWSTGQG